MLKIRDDIDEICMNIAYLKGIILLLPTIFVSKQILTSSAWNYAKIDIANIS